MRRTRRLLLRDLGRTTAGLVVVGSPLLAAACGEEDDPVVVQPTPEVVATPTPVAVDGYEVQRVDLGFVAAHVLVRGGEAVLVDTGVADSEDAIAEVLSALGVGWGDVGHVILTHKHPDHAGSLGAVADLAAEAALYAGEADIPQIVSPRDLVPVGDGDEVADLRIIATPGHTPGHVSVLDPERRRLIVGDALVGNAGRLGPPDPQFSEDEDVAIASVGVLAGLDVDEVLVSHGFPVDGVGTAELRALAEDLGAGA